MQLPHGASVSGDMMGKWGSNTCEMWVALGLLGNSNGSELKEAYRSGLTPGVPEILSNHCDVFVAWWNQTAT